jgi:RNA polymerase sigma-70 factor (ECF subfamily)
MAQHIGRTRLDELVHTHLPSLLRFAVRLTGTIHDGEDAAQETLLRISRRWKSLREVEAFRRWAFQILVNVVRDQHRKAPPEARHLEQETLAIAGDVPTPSEISELIELREEIDEKLQRLPPRQREVISLLAFEPYSPQEVAELLEIDVGNVYATLRIARLRLQESLSPPRQDEP